jgi:hypothetical protein
VPVCGVFIAAFFFYFAHPGLSYYFDADDVMNLRQAWPDSPWALLWKNAFFWEQSYRPLGLVLYRLVFQLFGLNPFPYHVACFALLLGNLVLVYFVAHRLTESTEAALLTTLLAAFHSRMDVLYYSSGMLYEIAAFTLFLAALLVYLRIRSAGRTPGVAAIAVLLVLTICGLNAKEMGATLCVILAGYELIYRPAGWNRWPGPWLAIGAVGAITVLDLVPKLASSSTFTASYRPNYSLSTLLGNWCAYAGDLFYQMHPVPRWSVVALWCVLAAAAVVTRSKALKFAVLFLLVTPLPVCFIETRSLNVFYIPVVGWALFAAAALVGLQRRWHVPFGAVFAAVAALLAAANVRDAPHRFYTSDTKSEMIRNLSDRMSVLHPNVPAGSHILFLNDPFDTVEWTPVSLLQLQYRDPTLEIHRKKMEVDRAAIATANHEIVLDYRNGQFSDSPSSAAGGALKK